ASPALFASFPVPARKQAESFLIPRPCAIVIFHTLENSVVPREGGENSPRRSQSGAGCGAVQNRECKFCSWFSAGGKFYQDLFDLLWSILLLVST
ncbi:Negative regulator of sporulation MDS3, partial [Frankliniella fusca]